MNFIDYIIIAWLVIALIRGFSRGAIIIMLDLVGFFVSIGGAFLIGPKLEPLVHRFLAVSDQIIRPVAFLGGYLLMQIAWSIISWSILRLTSRLEHSLVNRLLGLVISIGYSALTIGVLLILALNLPLPKKYRHDLDSAKLTPRLLNFVQPIRPAIEKELKTAITEITQLVTIKPDSKERLNLYLQPRQTSVNEHDELEMISLVNQFRQANQQKPLEVDPKLREAARAQALDMWRRHYFAHTNPDGQDPFDRLKAAGVQFVAAGENLALAPTLKMAHDGLINSPGHRANILESSFGHIGIGVIDGSPYGKMVVQEFTD